jgi:hypothetical protein
MVSLERSPLDNDLMPGGGLIHPDDSGNRMVSVKRSLLDGDAMPLKRTNTPR